MTDVEIKGLKKEVKKYIDHADVRMLKAVYAMLEADQEEDISIKDDWWDEISDGEKNAIEEGLRQLDNGEGIPHEEVIKNHLKKWL